MNPQRFAQANGIMQAPQSMPECSDIHCCHTANGTGGDQVCITAWKPTPEELVKLNLGEPVWLWCFGAGMPPVAVSADNPFQT